ncbi:SdrD B-like domain-containing protein, partial [Chloroflexota bacterium]
MSSGDTLADSDTTDGNGDYELTLDPGRYIVVEQVSDQSGWLESPDAGTTSVNTFNANYGEYGYDITLTSNQSDTGNDFANYEEPPPEGTKSGTKYQDLDANGVMDGSDAGLSGWTIAAFTDSDGSGDLSAADTLADSDATDGNGDYLLTLEPGRYIVVEQVSDQSGWFESPDAGTTSVNTYDADYGEYGYDITLAAGEGDIGNDFANYQQATKSGTKYEDFNGDGVMNGSDTGLGGWTVAAFEDVDDSGTLSAVDTLADSDTTDGSGYYELTLDPGRYIVVEQVSDQSGWFESPDGGTTLVNGYDTDYGEYGYDITLTSGQTDTGNDFANYEQATKSGNKYEDLDVNGLMDGSDAGLGGWTIAAFTDNDDSGDLSAGDTLADSDATDGNGDYELTLDPGRYIVVEQVSDQSGWFESPDADTTSVNTFNANYGEYGYDITLTSGQEDTGNDFANYQHATKSGTKYEDLDANGLMDGSDAGLAGWTIAAFEDVDSSDTLTAADTLHDSDLTDANGDYELELEADVTYIVVEQVSDKSGWIESPDTGTTSVNTYNAAYGEYGYLVTLESGESETGNDFGNYPQASIGDFVWNDLNQDGIQDVGELGRPGITINLYDGGNNFVATTTTDGAGFYLFSGLSSGSYYVEFICPSSCIMTLQDQGIDDTLDSDPNPNP